MLVLIDKTSNKVEVYSSVKKMFECRSEILKTGIQHYYNLNLDDWENKFCRVVKCEVTKTKKIEVKKNAVISPLQDSNQLTRTNENINLIDGNYVKKGNWYYFNFSGHIYKGSSNLEFWSFGLVRLKNNKKIFGEIKDIMFS